MNWGTVRMNLQQGDHMQQIVYAVILLLLSPFLVLLGLSLLPVILGIFVVWCIGKLIGSIFCRKSPA